VKNHPVMLPAAYSIYQRAANLPVPVAEAELELELELELLEVGPALHLPFSAVPKPHQWEVEVEVGVEVELELEEVDDGPALHLPLSAVPKPHQWEVEVELELELELELVAEVVELVMGMDVHGLVGTAMVTM